MKRTLIAAAFCAAGIAACGTENATESRAKVPPQPIIAAAPAEQPRQSVSDKYPAPKTESNMGEKEPLDPSEQEKH
jgi:nitrous oxide reductase accessory protein NosL